MHLINLKLAVYHHILAWQPHQSLEVDSCPFPRKKFEILPLQNSVECSMRKVLLSVVTDNCKWLSLNWQLSWTVIKEGNWDGKNGGKLELYKWENIKIPTTFFSIPERIQPISTFQLIGFYSKHRLVVTWVIQPVLADVCLQVKVFPLACALAPSIFCVLPEALR